MRYTTTLILALVAIGVAVLMIVFWDRLSGQAPEETEQKAGEQALVADATVDDVRTIAVLERGADGEFTQKLALEQTDGKWRLLKPVEAPADEYVARQLARAAVEAKYRQARDLSGPDAADPASLGLSEPLYRVTATLAETDDEEARTVTVDVGKATPFGNRLYVRLDEGEKAQVLNSDDLLNRVRKAVSEYRSRDLVDLTRDDLVRIDLEGGKGRVRLERAEEDRERWLLVDPMTARADPDLTDDLVREALNLRIKEFIADGAQELAPYGLEEPRLTLTLWKAGEPAGDVPSGDAEPGETSSSSEPAAEAAGDAMTGEDSGEPTETAPPPPEVAAVLKFGSFADMKRETVHLTTGEGRSVVSVAAEKLEDIDRSAQDLRDKHVLAFEKGRVKSIEVHNASGKFELEKKAGTWHLNVPGRAEAKAERSAVDSLLDELADLEVVYFDDEAAPEETVPPDSPGVRLRLEGEAGVRGFRIVLDEKAGSRIRNVRESWLGRVNEEQLDWYTKDWLAYPSADVMDVEPADVARVTVETPDRVVEVERADEEAWNLVRPVEAEADVQAVDDLLTELQFLKAERFVAAADDFGRYGLETGEVTCTVTERPAEEGAEPARHTLHLTVRPDGEILGRVAGSDLVFEVAERVLHKVAGELLPKELTDFSSWDIKEMVVAAGDAEAHLMKQDGEWYHREASGARGEKVGGDLGRGLASACAGLEVARWADYAAERLDRFGLDKPALRVTVTTDDGETTLRVSGRDVDPQVRRLFDRAPARYAMVEGGGRVGILAGSDLETILSAPEDLGIAPEEADGPAEKAAATEEAAGD